MKFMLHFTKNINGTNGRECLLLVHRVEGTAQPFYSQLKLLEIKMYLNKCVVLLGALFAGQLTFAGSVSGGGGGTLPGDKVEASYVQEAIVDSRTVIDAFLKGVETRFVLDGGTPSESFYQNYSKMFRAGADVFKLMNEVPFKVISDGACHDLDGSETDASGNVDVQGGICISVSRIQPKVTYANYKAEIAALILHEISHLYGSDEAEASAIQKVAVRFFAGTSSGDVSRWSFQVMSSLRSLSSMTEMISDAMKSGAKIDCNSLGKLQSAYMTAVHELSDGSSGMFLTRERQTEYFWQLPTRIMAMRDFLCTQRGYESEDVRHVSIEIFNKIWRQDSELSADEYFKRAVEDSSSFNRFPLVTIKIKKYSS
ncbi:MAG: hypothetical protein EOP06_11910, partial [Proteobacteria bacterium]